MAHLSKALVRDADDALAALDAALATILADCPHCFESSGYVWEHGNDWNSGPWSHQTNIPCRACNGTGVVEVPAEAITLDDIEELSAEDGSRFASVGSV